MSNTGDSSVVLPSWATDWVLLRTMDTAQLGRSKSEARIYVPPTIGHIANAARSRLDYQGPECDEAKELRVQALLPPVDVKDSPKSLPDASPLSSQVGSISAAVNETTSPPKRSRPKLSKRLHGVRVRVIAKDALERHSADIELLCKRKSKDDAKADREMAAAVLQRGGLRTVVLGRGWQERLRCLAEEMPNFGPAIEHVRTGCTLAQITGRPLRIAPMLLIGMPGLGKTLFATRGPPPA